MYTKCKTVTRLFLAASAQGILSARCRKFQCRTKANGPIRVQRPANYDHPLDEVQIYSGFPVIPELQLLRQINHRSKPHRRRKK
ncbi:hypothetical protein J6590_024193 [Homalodisca vitripennis]|nr:hypothetical protein J6590_024193 [Homalodisca vitripennis]